MKKKNLVGILLVVLLLSSCTKRVSTGDLVCQLSAKEKQVCSSVLSLESGVLRLFDKDQSFELVAHYDACFQASDLRIMGDFKRHPHQSVVDLELLAKKTELKMGRAEQFTRTIGLITLNNKSLTGRFVDIWAMIRTHTQQVENLPTINVSCHKQK
ncbi:MAG: hypothetical protein KAG20_07550 [Cocleimonas sp.]|nr:hypothetical protein [Cocleimonas sp.]